MFSNHLLLDEIITNVLFSLPFENQHRLQHADFTTDSFLYTLSYYSTLIISDFHKEIVKIYDSAL